MDMTAIKAKAAEINRNYNPDGLVPFPFEELAASLGNVQIFYLSPPDTISGFIYYEDGKFTIGINKDKPAARQYFTLAHEFGHLFLHEAWLRENAKNTFVDFSYTLDSGNMLLRPDENSTAQIDIFKEREANNFAAELLMPADKVKEFWNLTHDIQECATAFQVSTAAMAVRLDRLHLT